MRLEGTCDACRRDFLVDQVLESGGHCPWCSVAFQKDYAATLVVALTAAEDAAAALTAALERIGEMKPGFKLKEESFLGPIGAALKSATVRAR